MASLNLDAYENVSNETRELVVVANRYLTDNKGSDLELTDEQAEDWINDLLTSDNTYVSNNSLAALQVASFVDLRNEMRQNTAMLQNEIRAVGGLIVASHADTIDKLNKLQQGVASVSDNVVILGKNLEQVATTVLKLQNDFNEYVLRDERNNQIQIAKQDLTRLNLQLETDFGHNKELRRAAVGILQANDLNVRTDTILTLAEELMIKTPNYWLAPALVALANWVDASKAVSQGESASAFDVRTAITSIEGMTRESYSRERAKTALFFGLISRRANNISQANAWFKEYMDFQDPRAVDHTCMVLLDLYANGLMGRGPEEQRIFATMGEWLNELMEDSDASYKQTLVDDWKKKCIMLVASSQIPTGTFRFLRTFSPTWALLEGEMQLTTVHFELRQYLQNSLSVKDFAEEDMVLIDSMIADLVSEYDADELPIRREQEYLQLIVDLGGRKDLADKLRIIKDEILTESKSFVSIISDAGRDSELSHASTETQKLALRIQMRWICQAYSEVTQEYRARLPETIDFQLGDFKTQTDYGTDEDRVLNEFLQYANEKERSELIASKTGTAQKACLIGGAIAFVVGIICCFLQPLLGGLLTVAGLIICLYGLFAASSAKKRQQFIKEDMRNKRHYGTMIIRAFMAEARQWRQTYDERDAMFESIIAELGASTVFLEDGSIHIESSTQA